MMTLWTQLDSVQKLIVVIVPLGLLHHADHVGRADHSSWPFRPELGPFTFTLLICPVLALAYVAPTGHPVLGNAATILSVVLTGLLLVAALVAIRGGRAHVPTRGRDALRPSVRQERTGTVGGGEISDR